MEPVWIAAIVGAPALLAGGWFAGRWSRRHRITALDQEWRSRYQLKQRELGGYRTREREREEETRRFLERQASQERRLAQLKELAERAETQFEEGQRQIRTLEEQMTVLRDELASSHGSLNASEHKLWQYRKDAGEMRSRLEDAQAELDRRAERLKELESILSRRLERDEEAREHLRSDGESEAELHAEIDRLRERVLELEGLRPELDRERRRVRDLEQVRALVDEKDDALQRMNAEQRSQRLRFEREVSELRQQLSNTDDLKAIRGLGKATIRVLQGIGIKSFADLAQIGHERVSKLDERMRKRMEQQDWIGQARTLYEDKYGAPLAQPAAEAPDLPAEDSSSSL